LKTEDYRAYRRTHPAFHARIYQELRLRGYRMTDAIQMATIECSACGGYADHWHTMTGTTLDDKPQDLWDLVEGCTLVGNMACGNEATVSLESGEYYPHCEDCDNENDESDDEDNDDEEDDEESIDAE